MSSIDSRSSTPPTHRATDVSPVSTVAPTAVPRRRATLVKRAWWIPLGFVVVALVALLVTPVLVSRRVDALRETKFDLPDRGRVLVNDLEGAIATELLLRGRLGAPAVSARDSVYAAARIQAEADERELDSLTKRIGPEAVRRFDLFRALREQWQQHGGRSTAIDADGSAAAFDGGPALLAAAENLDSLLTALTEEGRLEIRRVQTFNVTSALVLAPMALPWSRTWLTITGRSRWKSSSRSHSRRCPLRFL